MLELAKPVMIDPADVAQITNRSVDEQLTMQIKATNSMLDQVIADNQALSKIAWMNCAVEQHYAEADKLKAYREKHYIPDVGVEFTNFEEFFLEREKMLVKALKAALT